MKNKSQSRNRQKLINKFIYTDYNKELNEDL